MFTSTSFRGRLLNHALHHQHSRVYNYDRSTIYGHFPSPSEAMTKQFLDLVHYDEGGRIFTYVLTLDGQWRFTETGKEFGIDLLSKHTMHSDVAIYIAFSGEFFIRRLAHKHGKAGTEENPTHPPADIEGGPPNDDPPRDPAHYELFIDNDSGTYRPNAKLLPQLKAFMEQNLPGLRVETLDCQADEERMGKLKQEQRDRKKNEGDPVVYTQGSDSSSVSSSDEEDLDQRAAGAGVGGTGGQKPSKEEKAKRKEEKAKRKTEKVRNKVAKQNGEKEADGEASAPPSAQTTERDGPLNEKVGVTGTDGQVGGQIGHNQPTSQPAPVAAAS